MLILQNGVLFVPVRGIGLQWEFFASGKSQVQEICPQRFEIAQEIQTRKEKLVKKEEITKCTLLFQEV